MTARLLDSFGLVDVVPGMKFARSPTAADIPDLSDDTPQPVSDTPASGTGTEASRSDHVHEGLHSISKSGDTPLLGDVTLSEGSDVTLTQSGNDIEIAFTGSVGSEKGQISLEAANASLYATASASAIGVSGTVALIAAIKMKNGASGALWRMGLRDFVASPNNQKLRLSTVFDATEVGKVYGFDVYTAGVPSGTNIVSGPLAWSVSTPLTINSGTIGVEVITEITLSDGAFQDNRDYLIRIERDGTDTATASIYILGALVTFSTD